MGDFPVEIRYATEPDAYVLGEINIAAFMDSLFFPNVFPEADTPSLAAFKRLNALQKLTDPKVHVLVAVEPTTGAIVAYSRWEIPARWPFERPAVELSLEAKKAAAEMMERAPQPMNKDVFEAFKALLKSKREKHLQEGDITLDMLAVSPGHQGKGIGSRILKWGIEKADSVQIRIYLEATPEGYPLYCKRGFKVIEEISIDYAYWGGTGKQIFHLMIREPQGGKP